MDRTALYAETTQQIVDLIEAGAGTWKMPWQAIAEAGQPVNALTHKGYRGGNHMVFAMVAAAKGYSGTWATYKQWQTLGAQVRKGEKSTYGVKWSVVEDRKTGEDRLVPYVFSVFAAEQVDGWTTPEMIERDTPERIEEAERFFTALGAKVVHGGNRACYMPGLDQIMLPELERFAEASAYYATAAHEHAHWTGNSARLDRNLTGKFGSDSYAVEELVAELSAAFTCCHLGISSTPRPDHASYLASWLRVLKADASAIFTAASKAQEASDYLVDHAEALAMA